MAQINNQFEACIFDMDGVLLDSEPFWRQAEREKFGQVGLHLSEEDCMETMGVRIDELVEYRYRQHPWQGITCPQMAQAIQERVAELVREKGSLLPGVREAISFLHSRGLRLALASSSSPMLIETVLQTLGLQDDFLLTCSAAGEPYGKPHPGVFIKAAQLLEVPPERCLVIEDSLNGVIAAKAALMTCVAVPEEAVAHSPKFAVADLQLSCLDQLPDSWERLTD